MPTPASRKRPLAPPRDTKEAERAAKKIRQPASKAGASDPPQTTADQGAVGGDRVQSGDPIPPSPPRASDPISAPVQTSPMTTVAKTTAPTTSPIMTTTSPIATTNRSTSPPPTSPRPASPRSSPPRPSSPKPTSPRPTSPRPTSPRPTSPRPTSPRPTSPPAASAPPTSAVAPSAPWPQTPPSPRQPPPRPLPPHPPPPGPLPPRPPSPRPASPPPTSAVATSASGPQASPPRPTKESVMLMRSVEQFRAEYSRTGYVGKEPDASYRFPVTSHGPMNSAYSKLKDFAMAMTQDLQQIDRNHAVRFFLLCFFFQFSPPLGRTFFQWVRASAPTGCSPRDLDRLFAIGSDLHNLDLFSCLPQIGGLSLP